jgi:hypothetical protein
MELRLVAGTSPSDCAVIEHLFALYRNITSRAMLCFTAVTVFQREEIEIAIGVDGNLMRRGGSSYS